MRNGEYYLAVVSHDANIDALKHAPRGHAKLMDLGTSARLGAVCGAGILFDRGVADRGVLLLSPSLRGSSKSMTMERGGPMT